MKFLKKLFFTSLLIEFLVYYDVLEITHPVVAKYHHQLVTFLKIILMLITD